MNILFASQNPFKAEELIPLADEAGISLRHVELQINELQTMDTDALIRDKTLKAFSQLRLPVIVDHASLAIDSLGGMPGNLTQLFWDRLEDKICSMVHFLGNPEAVARTTLGYCDGKKLYSFAAEQKGEIAKHPEGNREFQWDTIFIPTSYSATYAEMPVTDKNQFSQRKKAFDELLSLILRS